MYMLAITAVMIVRDEENHLADCLESLKQVCNEIVIVDTGSVDKTIQIANKYTCEVHQFTWSDDFSAARNFAISKVKRSDWCLMIDADEIIAAPIYAKKRLLKLISNCTPYTLGTIEILSLGSSESDEIKHQSSISRIFNRHYFKYEGAIHEQLICLKNSIKASQVDSGIRVLHSGYVHDKQSPNHKSHRNIRILTKALQQEPNNEYLEYQLGQAYFSQDNFIEAKQHFTKALEIIDFSQTPAKGSSQAVSREVLTGLTTSLCYSLINLNELSEASELMAFHLKLNHFGIQRADFFHALGHLKLALEDLQGALDAFEVSLELGAEKEDVLGSGSYASLFNIGIVFEAAKDPDKALEFYTASLSLNPSFKPAIERIVSFTLDYKTVFPKEIFDLGNEESWLNTFIGKATEGILSAEQHMLIEQNIKNISENALNNFKSICKH